MAREGITLQRLLGSAHSLEAGMWSSETASGKPAVCCPLCGETSEIDFPWIVQRDGVVIPIWSCPRCPCIEWITLEMGRE